VETSTITNANLNGANGVTVVGDYAYVTSALADRLTVIDISDPTNLVETSTITNANLNGANGVTVVGDYAYVTSALADSLTVLDISDPTNLVEVVSYTDASLNGASSVFASNGQIFVTSQAAGSLSVFSDDYNTTPGNLSGATIAGIGDFDGDGVNDYMIGLPNDYDSENSGNFVTGGTVIVSGADQSVFSELDSQTDSSDTGQSVSSVGDINNDGYADILVSAPNEVGTGKSYLFYGAAGSLGTNIDVGGAVQIDGAATGDRFGESVSGIGDFDGDGTQDFIIGAPMANSGVLTNAGQATIHYGNNPSAAAITIDGIAINQQLGSFVDGIGDFNGDGKSDVLIAAENPALGLEEAYILFGGEASYDLTNLDSTSTGVKLTINNSLSGREIIGGGSVGDFNGDGFDDVGIAISNGTNKADIFVIYGTNGPGLMDLNYADLLNSQNAFHMKWDGNHDNIEISGIGDIDGDGFDDVGIGTPEANGGDGQVIVVDGREGGGDRTIVNGIGGINATADNQSLIGSNGTDAFEQNNNANLSFRGGAGEDTFVLDNTDFISLDGGTQNTTPPTPQYDTINFAGSGTLDFTDVDFEQISGIEKIGFTQDGSTIRLTKENLFNLLQSSDTGELKIDFSGSGTNTLIIDQDGDGTDDFAGTPGSATGTPVQGEINTATGLNHVGDTSGYEQFNIGGYQLYIDQNITVDVQ